MITSGSSFTYGDLRDMVAYSLSDSEFSKYSQELIYHACLGAIDAIMPWCPKTGVMTVTGDGVASVFALPWNTYKVEAVQDVLTGMFLDRAQLVAGKARGSQKSIVDWMEYPRGSLSLSKVVDSGKEYRVYYQMLYGKPVNVSDTSYVLDTPRSATFGMVYWACAHSVIPQSSASAEIRQFNMKVDSGDPTDNVVEQTARFYRQLFVDEMNRQPKISIGVS